MANDSDLIDLLNSIGDRAPAVDGILDRLALHTTPELSSRRRWAPIVATAAAIAATVVLSVVVAGGVVHHHRDAAGSGLANQPTVDRATYPLPLDAYFASDAQMRTLQRAQYTLAQRCALARGVSIRTARVPAADAPAAFLASVANNVRPLTLEQARTIGYDLYPSGRSAFDDVVAGLTPGQLETFEGWSSSLGLPKPTDRFLLTGGCFGQAGRTLLKGATPIAISGQSHTDGQPGLFDDDATVNNLYLNEARSSEGSPEVRRAQGRWAACMDAHGYPGLHDTERMIQSETHLQSPEAKRQAAQDVRCKQATGFMTDWVAATTKAQKAVIRAHRSQLAGFKKRLATRMANAARALK